MRPLTAKENLQDHVCSAFSFGAQPSVGPRDPLDLQNAQKEYEQHRTGSMAEGACYTFAYMPLHPFLSLEEQKDLSIGLDHYRSSAATSTAFELEKFNFICRMIESPVEATATAFLSRKPTVPVSVCAMLSYPFSAGKAHIQSSDPFTSLLMDFKYLSHPPDAQVLSYHLRALHRIAQKKQLSELHQVRRANCPTKASKFRG